MRPWCLAIQWVLWAPAVGGSLTPPLAPRNDTARSPVATRALQAAQVVVEVYYSPSCEHCLDFLRGGVTQLIEAQLPGSLVQLTVLPLPFSVLPQEQCTNDPSCYGDLAPLCAMQATLPHPTPIDSPALLPALQFLICDLAQSVAAPHLSPSLVKDCAAEAGLPWQPIEDCARGQEVRDIMYSADFNSAAPAAIDRLAAAGYRRDKPYSMPLVFINGEFLSCGGGGCTASRTPSGNVALPNPGSLLALVCAKLDPQPAACQGDLTPAAPLPVGPTPACENCAEVNVFHWQRKQKQPAPWHWLVGAGLVLCIGIVARYARRPVRGSRDPAWTILSSEAADA